MKNIDQSIKDLPLDIQMNINKYWSWNKYYSNNIIKNLNIDLSKKNLIDFMKKYKIYNNDPKKYLRYLNLYIRKNKIYILNLNNKIKKIINNKGLAIYYKNKYKWFSDINKDNFKEFYLPEEVKYYGYMLLHNYKLKKKYIYYSLLNNFDKTNIKINTTYLMNIIFTCLLTNLLLSI